MQIKLEPADSAVMHCPVCGAEDPERIISQPGLGVIGCDECLCVYDAWEYFYPDG